MTPEEKLKLITQNLEEVVDKDKLYEILKQRNIRLYWGTAPTGRPHLGYMFPLAKIADFLKAEAEVIILFADLHAFLDNMKTSFELLKYRTEYYEILIKEILKIWNIPLDKLRFVMGSNFELNRNYILDMFKISALASVRDTKKAGSEVVKQIETPKMSSLIYPILQALDEEYLEADAEFGGIDQRKIFMFSREFMPKIGYKKRIYLMNQLIPGLTKSGKMSSSEPNSKIDFENSDKTIRKKINKAYCMDGVVENNALLLILKILIFKKLKLDNKKFIINRPENYGGRIEFSTYEEVEKAFASKELSSIDLKQGVADEIIKLVQPIRETLNKHQELIKKAYPD